MPNDGTFHLHSSNDPVPYVPNALIGMQSKQEALSQVWWMHVSNCGAEGYALMKWHSDLGQGIYKQASRGERWCQWQHLCLATSESKAADMHTVGLHLLPKVQCVLWRFTLPTVISAIVPTVTRRLATYSSRHMHITWRVAKPHYWNIPWSLMSYLLLVIICLHAVQYDSNLWSLPHRISISFSPTTVLLIPKAKQMSPKWVS